MSIIAKISVKSVCGDTKEQLKKMIKEDVQEKQLMRVIGIARKTRIVETQYGESIGLVGEFRAINLETQEKFHSGQAFLPTIAANIIAGQIGENKELEFALDITLKQSNNPAGYEYGIIPLIEPAENNPLELLEAKICK